MAIAPLKACVLHTAPRLADCRHCATRSLAICAALEPDELESLEAVVLPITRREGQSLFQEGDPLHHVFIITSGYLKTFKLLPDGRRQITGFPTAGDFLGLAGNGTYGFGAEALTQVRLCQVKRRDMDALVGRYPNLSRRLFEIARHELAVAQEQQLLLGRKTSRERVASFLLSAAERAQCAPEAEANCAPLPMTRGDIGDYLGLTLETVSRVFSAFRREKLIDTSEERVTRILDREGLEAIAAGDGGG
jgi:CRP/FNR family transcriptional regulator